MRITPANLSSLGITDKTPRFGLSKECKGFKELISEDVSGGILRAYEQDEILIDNLARLVKKNKEADEESGGKILYLAFGFLKWYSGGDEEEKYAPLVLCPVTLKLGKGKTYYEISASGDELSVNSTLLEFLKQEFNVDIRGLDGNVQDLKVSEILAMVRMETGAWRTTAFWRRSVSRATRLGRICATIWTSSQRTRSLRRCLKTNRSKASR